MTTHLYTETSLHRHNTKHTHTDHVDWYQSPRCTTTHNDTKTHNTQIYLTYLCIISFAKFFNNDDNAVHIYTCTYVCMYNYYFMLINVLVSNKNMLAILHRKHTSNLQDLNKLTLVLTCIFRVDTFAWANSRSCLNFRIYKLSSR